MFTVFIVWVAFSSFFIAGRVLWFVKQGVKEMFWKQTFGYLCDGTIFFIGFASIYFLMRGSL